MRVQKYLHRHPVKAQHYPNYIIFLSVPDTVIFVVIAIVVVDELPERFVFTIRTLPRFQKVLEIYGQNICSEMTHVLGRLKNAAIHPWPHGMATVIQTFSLSNRVTVILDVS